jgi:hypothetical protein
MAVSVECPQCRTSVTVARGGAGQTVFCPKCLREFIPSAKSVSTAAGPARRIFVGTPTSSKPDTIPPLPVRIRSNPRAVPPALLRRRRVATDYEGSRRRMMFVLIGAGALFVLLLGIVVGIAVSNSGRDAAKGPVDTVVAVAPGKEALPPNKPAAPAKPVEPAIPNGTVHVGFLVDTANEWGRNELDTRYWRGDVTGKVLAVQNIGWRGHRVLLGDVRPDHRRQTIPVYFSWLDPLLPSLAVGRDVVTVRVNMPARSNLIVFNLGPDFYPALIASEIRRVELK